MTDDAPMAGDSSTALRFRIGHLFLWIALAGASLANLRYLANANSSLGWSHPPIVLAITWIISMATVSGQATIALVSGWWRWHRRITSFQPGEWLAIFAATYYLMMLASVGSSTIARSNYDSLGEEFFWLTLPGNLFALLFLILFASLAFQSREAICWKMMYVVSGFEQLVGITLTAMCLSTDSLAMLDQIEVAQTWSWKIATSLTAATIVAAAVVDMRRNHAKRWTHWSGLAFWILSHVPNFII